MHFKSQSQFFFTAALFTAFVTYFFGDARFGIIAIALLGLSFVFLIKYFEEWKAAALTYNAENLDPKIQLLGYFIALVFFGLAILSLKTTANTLPRNELAFFILYFGLGGVMLALSVYYAYETYIASPHMKPYRDRQENLELLKKTEGLPEFPTPNQFTADITSVINTLTLPDTLRNEFLLFAQSLYIDEDYFWKPLPELDDPSFKSAVGRYIQTHGNPKRYDIFLATVSQLLIILGSNVTRAEGLSYSIKLIDSFPNPKATAAKLYGILNMKELVELRMFESTRAILNYNDAIIQDAKTPKEYLQFRTYNTKLRDILDLEYPTQFFKGDVRFEHTYVVAPPGTGKTNLLSTIINADFTEVAKGNASIIVMESNRDLIKSIEWLKRFAPGGDLEGRLVVIDVEDVENPIALNLFDIGLSDLRASARDKEALYNSAISLLDYVFRALLQAELTSRQSTLFNFTIQLLLQIPNATLDTLIDLMQPGAITKFQAHLNKLDADTRRFFEIKFDAREFAETKAQIVDRIFAIKRIRTLARMFSAPRTKLNLYEEMGKGRVILINTAKSLLQKEGVELFGRFMIALILLAAEKRQLSQHRLPCYVYIDEAHDIVKRDENLPILLDQARKYRVAMILAHQRLDQMDAPVLNALMSSTAIKFASRLSDANASVLARNMGTTPDFFDQPTHSFAVSVRGQIKNAISVKIPHTDFASMPRMSPDDHKKIIDDMRRRFSFTPTQPIETSPETPLDTSDPTKPSKW